jgi:hypothetical protein
VKWLVITSFLVGGCAHDVEAHFPSQPTDPTGTIVLQLTKPASGVTVAINGALVVDDEHTGRVVITGVPVGTDEVIMAVNGGDKAFRVFVDSQQPTTVPLGVPDEGAGFIKTLAGSILTVLVYSLLHR